MLVLGKLLQLQHSRLMQKVDFRIIKWLSRCRHSLPQIQNTWGWSIEPIWYKVGIHSGKPPSDFSTCTSICLFILYRIWCSPRRPWIPCVTYPGLERTLVPNFWFYRNAQTVSHFICFYLGFLQYGFETRNFWLRLLNFFAATAYLSGMLREE